MPIPITRDVGTIIRFLKKEKPDMPRKQKIAIALNQARGAGADIPEKPKHHSSHRFHPMAIKMVKMLKERRG